MCGIVGFALNEDSVGYIIDGLKGLEYRGYDSAGISVTENGKIKTVKTAGRIDDLKTLVDKSGLSGRVGIGHTRWATHGAATEKNAHPHISFDKKFAVVHNGIIENYGEIKELLAAKGVGLSTDTDTEAVAQLLALFYDGDLLGSVERTVGRLRGSYALGIICTDRPDKIVAVKKGSPLVVGLFEGGGILASDLSAILPYTKSFCRLEDGEICITDKEKIDIFKDGKQISKAFDEADHITNGADKGEFEHFMIKEIFDQPEAAKSITEKRIKDGRVMLEELNEIFFDGLRQINIVACGSAYHAGVAGRYILEELLKIPVSVDIASEFRYRSPLKLEESLTVFISQSGETADTIAAAEEIRRLGGRTVSIVNVKDSHLSRVTDCALYTEAGPEISVATTKGYTSQVIMLCLMGIWLADRLESAEKKALSAAVDAVKSLPEIILRCLGAKEQMQELAKKIRKEKSVYFIGRNLDFAVALEASLKLKEVSYIHSEAYPAGELKHGSIALIEEGSAVFALNCYDPLIEKTAVSIREVRARGGRVFAVCREGDELTPAVADEVVSLPIIHPVTEAVCEVIPFQLLAYFTAKERGVDIDKPRNLAKSVTVE